MKRQFALALVALWMLLASPASAAVQAPMKAPGQKPTTINYGTITLGGGTSFGDFPEEWDLTKCDLTLSATVDLSGIGGDGSSGHAWPELGIRESGPIYINPPGAVWLITDYVPGTFGPDEEGSPVFDNDDKVHLQNKGGESVWAYDLPSDLTGLGLDASDSYRVWFDRDGVEPSVANNPLFSDGITHNTEGIYEIEMHFLATGKQAGEAYLFIHDLAQGFETDGITTTMEFAPAGRTFSGDMRHMLVFYSLVLTADGSSHEVTFADIEVTGCPALKRGKKQARANLVGSSPPGDKHSQKLIEKAAIHMDRGLDPTLWRDDAHLSANGEMVFEADRQALSELRKIEEPSMMVMLAIGALVESDRHLAQAAIDEALATTGNAQKIAQAHEEMARAQDEISHGNPEQGIEHYGKAWKKAYEAMDEVTATALKEQEFSTKLLLPYVAQP